MEKNLVLRAQGGDQEAFILLVAAILDRSHRLARLILRSDEGAADAVQEALVAAWVNLPGLRDPDRFEAWTHRLLVRSCYAVARRDRRRSVAEIRSIRGSIGDVRDDWHALEDRDRVERGFRHLSVEQRAVLVARHYLELPDADAARLLGVPTGTYKSRLNRAGTALRAAIESDERSAPVRKESMA